MGTSEDRLEAGVRGQPPLSTPGRVLLKNIQKEGGLLRRPGHPTVNQHSWAEGQNLDCKPSASGVY